MTAPPKKKWPSAGNRAGPALTMPGTGETQGEDHINQIFRLLNRGVLFVVVDRPRMSANDDCLLYRLVLVHAASGPDEHVHTHLARHSDKSFLWRDAEALARAFGTWPPFDWTDEIDRGDAV